MKQTHLLLLLGILLFLCYCNREKIEAFGNQLIVPQFEFAILTPNQDPMSGYFQEEICRDDPKWKKGDKKCIDYSMDRNSCLDQGEDGVSANEACPVSCDSCPSSVKIKRRLPSPVEDIEEPEYSVFEGGMGMQGGEIGSVDYRDIYERLDEINDQLDIYTAMPTDTAPPWTLPDSATDLGVELKTQLARYGIDASVPTCYVNEHPASPNPETGVLSKEICETTEGGVWGSMQTHMVTQATKEPVQRLPNACVENEDCMAAWYRLYDLNDDKIVSDEEFFDEAHNETCGEASEIENPCFHGLLNCENDAECKDGIQNSCRKTENNESGKCVVYEIDPAEQNTKCQSKTCNFDAGPDHRTCCKSKYDNDWFKLENDLTERQVKIKCEVFEEAFNTGHYIRCKQ